MIPTVDPRVKYLGTSYLRSLNAETMKALEGAVVIQDAEAEPLVVIVPFQTYMKMQEHLLALPLYAKHGYDRQPANSDLISEAPEPTPSVVRKSVNGEMVVPAPRPKRINKREAAIQERAAGDLTAQAVGRDNIDYSDVESTPTTHVATLDAVGPPIAENRGKVSMENWRANRKPLTKPKDQK